ncbi:MAG: YfiR family protein [Methylococcaceae bacterium]
MLATKKTLTLAFCALIFFSHINQARSRSVEKQAVLAALTLNIARFTSWPESDLNNIESALNLCVIGDNIVQRSFNNIDNKVVNRKTIHIINLSRLRNLQQCHLLYISELERNKLAPLLAELEGQSILTIGDNKGFLQAGGMVGLEMINGKIQLHISLSNIKQSGLVISSRLLKLANIVDFPIPAQKLD